MLWRCCKSVTQAVVLKLGTPVRIPRHVRMHRQKDQGLTQRLGWATSIPMRSAYENILLSRGCGIYGTTLSRISYRSIGTSSRGSGETADLRGRHQDSGDKPVNLCFGADISELDRMPRGVELASVFWTSGRRTLRRRDSRSAAETTRMEAIERFLRETGTQVGAACVHPTDAHFSRFLRRAKQQTRIILPRCRAVLNP